MEIEKVTAERILLLREELELFFQKNEIRYYSILTMTLEQIDDADELYVEHKSTQKINFSKTDTGKSFWEVSDDVLYLLPNKQYSIRVGDNIYLKEDTILMIESQNTTPMKVVHVFERKLKESELLREAYLANNT